ncbi:uncharacterized protein SETTUDRAFT_73803, partial [Exserohilum turcica Et28A]
IARHRQKDEEAGAEGCGVLNTRKRMWKDAEGKIVTKKPTLVSVANTAPLTSPLQDQVFQSLQDLASFAAHDQSLPISPPSSNNPSLPNTLEDHDSGIGSNDQPVALDPTSISAQDTFSPIDPRFWSTDITQPQPESFPSAVFDDASFDDIFNPDTASSFNAPFTTMSNYNWLFDMDWSKNDTSQQIDVQEPFPVSFDENSLPQANTIFSIDLDHTSVEKGSNTGCFGSLPRQLSEPMSHHSPVQIIPPSFCEQPESISHAVMPEQPPTHPDKFGIDNAHANSHSLPILERPMSLLNPSRSLPVIDELARQQLLDLINIMQPTVPDGSTVTRDDPLLSLSCLQTYCDLFFTRFNTTYPLIHMSTFDPSKVDTLLLASVLLLGATYGEKDAHQLAVCIHDVLRPQIFASASFSAKPDLWVLQTILLVECFGKSRAGQKQHDMSHLFHGLLINLIRRSDCQTIRSHMMLSDDVTCDLEDEWRTWCEAEEKKRLAFLCFMWDTQHAVLFCQSLCMSAFELRSSMPCDQVLWEASSAESWQQLRRTRCASPPPVFLSCLKLYLQQSQNSANPPAALIPKSLNAFSRSLLFHGLMSIAWDMQRRDQTSLGVSDAAPPLGNWRDRLAASYTAWHTDYESFCTQYTQLTPSHTPAGQQAAREFSVHRVATLALYHAAHILLHAPFLDLQIYAGARHILGRPVARSDYARSQRAVKKWVAEQTTPVQSAVWHAAALVRDSVDVLDPVGTGADVGNGRLWHHAWAVYLAALVIWGAWYARPASSSSSSSSSQLLADQPLPVLSSHAHEDDDDDDDIIWDPTHEMHVLLNAILRQQ